MLLISLMVINLSCFEWPLQYLASSGVCLILLFLIRRIRMFNGETVTKDIAVAPVNFTGQAKHKTFVIIAVLVKFEGDKQELFLCIVAALLITIYSPILKAVQYRHNHEYFPPIPD